MKFPVICKTFPVLRDIFPDILPRELLNKWLQQAVSRSGIGAGSPEIAKFPVKFPVSREFAWRRVRSSLRRQPGVRCLEISPPAMAEMPANGGLLRFSEQSPDTEFGRFWSEIAESLRLIFEILPFLGDCDRRLGFSPHCVAELTVQLAKFSGKLGMPSPCCRVDVAVL